MIVTIEWLRAAGVRALGTFAASFFDGMDTSNPEHIQRARTTGLDMRWLAENLPVEGLVDWAPTHPDWIVRWTAARRLPVEQIGWAPTDREWLVRCVAVIRLPVEQIGWGPGDPDPHIRCVSAERLPVELLDWALTDPNPSVRTVARARRRAHSITKPDAT